MFLSHEKNVSKKTFQKPNILRKKSKVAIARPILASVTASTEAKSVITTSTHTETETVSVQHEEIVITHEAGYTNNSNTEDLVWELTTENNHCDDKGSTIETAVDASINNITVFSDITQVSDADKNFNQNSLNIESFINNDASKGSMSVLNIDAIPSGNIVTQAKTKWCLDLSNTTMDIIIKNYSTSQGEEEQNFIIGVVPSTPVVAASPHQQPEPPQQEPPTAPAPIQTKSVDCFTNRAVKFKCDEPNCSKGFWSEEKLRKHKNSHKKQSATRTPAQIKIECPVKKINDDGTEDKCGSTFLVRGDLLKHLDTDHTPEDALHRCEVCGRRFFWATGLRAHAASACARGGLACAWPGCARVFRLPCRLREHARAHTGDRPYLCRYPNCGWAFRSASKLVRHARRHTDERRHACAACGRAFLRREHLRDHAARHHAPRRARHACAHAACGQTFTNMSTLYMHMKKVHRRDDTECAAAAAAAAATVDATPAPESVEENVYLVGVVPEGATRAARTHCTWPLARVARRAPALLLEDDADADAESQVEQGDGSTSNVYTVRSDLFLHGNAPVDDDSQHMGASEVASSATPLDADLCLIDSHPTIDLMQEELMYDDTAVDESSFRVFLMNGEELT